MIVQKEGLPPYRYMIAELEADARAAQIKIANEQRTQLIALGKWT